jgi:hypothetical protein
MSRRIIWADVSKRVASDAVSFIHRERWITSADRFGGVRTYSGSKTNVKIHRFVKVWKTYINPASNSGHEMEVVEGIVSHPSHIGG